MIVYIMVYRIIMTYKTYTERLNYITYLLFYINIANIGLITNNTAHLRLELGPR